MDTNFDFVHERRNSASKKWDNVKEHFETEKNVLPMWVADMDFKAPSPVIKALKERTEQGIYGYTIQTESHLNSMINWFKEKHNWSIHKDWISHSPGIIPALSLIIQTFTKPNDKIIVQSPVHHAFYRVINLQERIAIENQLQIKNGHYSMDFEDLEKKLNNGAKILILCNPHNPVGRVWTKEELVKIGELCLKYNALVISDEVWCDIVYEPNMHTPYASISSDFANHSITCVSPSKTFNLMGIKSSEIITPNQLLHERIKKSLETFFLSAPNFFSVIASESAYNKGGEWLNSLLEYLEKNIQYITHFLNNNMPEVKLTKPEGTYLAWLDFRSLKISNEKLQNIFIEEANVGLEQGTIFGTGGEGFLRLNFACPLSVLEKGLNSINKVLKENDLIN